MPAAIKFYGKEDPYWEFSNFYVRSIMVDTQEWLCTEAFFQAMKTLDLKVREYIRTELTRPGQIKNYCTEQIQLREDWEDVVGDGALHKLFSDDQGVIVERTKDHFMYQALVAKYTQHRDLGELLLSTGDAPLIENTQKVGSDPYWGNGPSGNGLNKLGRMLMLVRTNLHRHWVAE